MNTKSNQAHLTATIAIMLLGVLYFLFPMREVTADSYAFAADIRYDMALYRPHHLLYSPLMKWLIYPFMLYTDDVLLATQWVNALLMLCSLYIMKLIIIQLGRSPAQVLLAILWVGLSYGMWRFAVQNEPYIMATLVSLTASYLLLKGTNALWVGLWAASACLIHQVQFWWWLGILVYYVLMLKDVKSSILYLLTAAIVPLVYYWIYATISHEYLPVASYWEFMFHDYIHGQADVAFSLYHVLFFLVGIARSFIQVHTFIPNLWSISPIFYLPLILMIVVLITIWKHRKAIIHSWQSTSRTSYQKAHLIILICSLLFSLISVGNSEFIVALPIWIMIVWGDQVILPRIVSVAILVAMFCWNFLYGIYPYTYLPMNAHDRFLSKIDMSNKQNVLIADDNILPEKYSYHSGMFVNEQILMAQDISINALDSMHREGKRIYTDVPDDASVQTRSDWQHNAAKSWQAAYTKLPIDSMTTIRGVRYLYQILPSKQ